ncbi:MAG: TIR domain-containing protein [Geminicoccaceae bacterium]
MFFSFHHQQDIWRVNQIRNSWRYRHESEREAEGFYDGSIWERSKAAGDESFKALIREDIKNTSVTCVLAGTHTYRRRWVRYEIARSIVKGNGLLTVKIHSIRDSSGSTTSEGPNPLDYMGVYRVPDGRTLLADCDDSDQWRTYPDYTQAVDLPAGWEQPGGNTVIPLSRCGRVYDYVAQ